jgi:two-component system nitrogen regulation response regulator GlnG/two-component system response regulator HydG
MSAETTAHEGPNWLAEQDSPRARDVLALVIAWSAGEPQRLGEVAILDERGARLLGRGEPNPKDPAERLRFMRQRPFFTAPRPPLQDAGISRTQALLRATANGIEFERLGACPMLLNGSELKQGTLRPGDVLTLKNQLVLLCVTRPEVMARTHACQPESAPPFGEPDDAGLVGESPAVWELRERLAFAATSDRHVLLLGASGSGKELAAQTIHGLSERRRRTLVSRNAATLPASLVDAELFGNVKNYPNPGMPERRGLIGEADGGTLFLDEIGEVPEEVQAHLLRVMDAGEYQRLGDARPLRSSFRLIAATNRDVSELKHDLAARLTVRIELPSLQDRREDIPLILRHLLRRAANANPTLFKRFAAASGDFRVAPALVERLLRQDYTHHVRELDRLLWDAAAGSPGDFIAVPAETSSPLRSMPPPANPASEPTAEDLKSALEAQGGSVTKAAAALGLSSRYALYRLLKKHGLDTEA